MKHYVLKIIEENPYLTMAEKSFWIDAFYKKPEVKGLYISTEVQLRHDLGLVAGEPLSRVSNLKVFHTGIKIDSWRTSSKTDDIYYNTRQAFKKQKEQKRVKALRLLILSSILLVLGLYFIFK